MSEQCAGSGQPGNKVILHRTATCRACGSHFYSDNGWVPKHLSKRDHAVATRKEATPHLFCTHAYRAACLCGWAEDQLRSWESARAKSQEHVDLHALAAFVEQAVADAAVSLPEEARCELCHDAIEQNEACVLDPTGDRWHLCNRFGVDCWEYANTPLPPAPAVSLELPEPPRRTPNREPQPSDGPDFWADHAAWKAQQSTEPPIEDAGSGGVW